MFMGDALLINNIEELMKLWAEMIEKSYLLVLEKKQPLVKHSMARVYEARRFPYFLERATTRAASVITDIRPRNILTA